VRWRISTVLPASEQKRKDLPQINGRAGRALALTDPVRPRGHSAPKQPGGQDEPLVFAGNQRTDGRLTRARCFKVQCDLPAMGFAFDNGSSDAWERTPGIPATRVPNSRGGREAGCVPLLVQTVWPESRGCVQNPDGELGTANTQISVDSAKGRCERTHAVGLRPSSRRGTAAAASVAE